MKLRTIACLACLLSFNAAAQYAPAEKAELTTISTLDVSRYLGTWYEIAKFPNWFQRNCASDTRAEYSLDTEGSLRVLGTEMNGLRQRDTLRNLRSRIAQVHQGLNLVGRLSVIDNVLIGGAARASSMFTWLRRWPALEREAAQAALARVGMAWAASRRTDSLSGGERQFDCH